MSFNFFSHKNAFVVCKTTLKRLSKAPPFSKEYSILEYLMSSIRHFLHDQIRKVNYEILISLNKNNCVFDKYIYSEQITSVQQLNGTPYCLER